MLCAARRHRFVLVGCGSTRCGRRRWRGHTNLHQSHRRITKNGTGASTVFTILFTTDTLCQLESLPMNGQNGEALQNVLSISTAASNRYLLHFNSLHSLTQWTGGIRLAMFEHATLQESYTGSILAGKGKQLNSINQIMERSRFPTEDWARVRFGAGTPWRRCWCVISPPDEKAFAKAQKNNKKKSAYDRSPPIVKGDIKFYESRKVTKKSKPIATITDAFSAYALYPQSKALIEQSTLVKVEGMITIHATQQTTTTTEGFIFVMAEPHPAISGFEMMLRWLMPCYDTFALYGRPNKLIADVFDTRSLMFAMPTHRRYGYLELIDVAGLIHTDGSSRWSEREWRKQLKILTSKRITSQPTGVARAGTDLSARHRRGSRSSVNLSSMSRTSLNLPPTRGGIAFAENDGSRSTPGSRHGSPAPGQGAFAPPSRTDSAPAGTSPFASPPHKRSASERAYRRNNEPSRLSFEAHQDEMPPMPPPHGVSAAQDEFPPMHPNDNWHDAEQEQSSEHSSTPERENYGHFNGNGHYGPPAMEPLQPNRQPLQPFQPPPTMAHKGGQRPPVRPNQMPDLRRANSHVDAATLAQLADMNRANGGAGMNPDSGMYQQQQPPGHVMSGPYRGPDSGPGYPYLGPHSSNGMSPIGQPMGHMPIRDRRAPPAGFSGAGGGGMMPPGRLPTIPGTPAVEQPNQFDMQAPSGRRPSAHRETSNGSVTRKPLPERPSQERQFPERGASYGRQY